MSKELNLYTADQVKELLDQQIKRSRNAVGRLDHDATDEKILITLAKVKPVSLPPPAFKGLNSLAETWQIEDVTRYYYASGRNYWTYVEITAWYNPVSLERKEVKRLETISTGEEWKLPDWAQLITDRRKNLEASF